MNVCTNSGRRQARERYRSEGRAISRRTISLAITIAALTTGVTVRAAEVKRLTMAEAVDLALKQNRALKIARLQIREYQEKKASAKSTYFPKLHNDTNILHITELQNIDIPAASFGKIPGVGVFPPRDISLGQGKKTLVGSGTPLPSR